MKQTLQLTTITDKWLIALQNSAELNDYCLAEYGKKPTIFVGLNPKQTISEEFLPAITIYPIGKLEGLDKEQYTYTMFCGWDILHEGVNEVDGVVKLDGMKKSDELGQLLYRTLSVASQDNPISAIRYELDAAWSPRWPGWFFADIDIFPPLGGYPIEY